MMTPVHGAGGNTSPAFLHKIPPNIVAIFITIILDAFFIWLVWNSAADGLWFFTVTIILIALIINYTFLGRKNYPLRWLVPSIAMLILMVLYPLVYTLYTAFTNYSQSQLLTKQQALQVIEAIKYLPEGISTYQWVAYRSPENQYLLLLIDDKKGVQLLAPVGQSFQSDIPLSSIKIPDVIANYEKLNRIETVKYLTDLTKLEFGSPPSIYKIKSLNEAAQYQQRYVNQPDLDRLLDQETGTVFTPIDGTFTSPDGQTLVPSFFVPIGLRNFSRLFHSAALRGPLLTVIEWTFEFSILAVVTTFFIGLILALIFNDPVIPINIRKSVRAIFLLPYAMPFYLSILVWRGMMNPHIGVLNRILEQLINYSPPWLSDPLWTKIGILIVNLYLGFPYMFLICTGALQSIPSDLMEAAEVDGANPWQKISLIQFPLLLIALGPLLIFSFAFNFNNFNVIYLFNNGGPPIPGSPTPAGYTDILISYTYRLAFEGGRGGEYGYAAAISIIIFIFLAVLTLIQFRYTRIWEQASENV